MGKYELSSKCLDLDIPFSKIIKMKNIVGNWSTLTTIESLYPDADIIVNTALFDMSNGNVISRVVTNGVRHGSSDPWASAFGIAFGDEVGPRLSWDNGVGAPEFLGPYSHCILEGKIEDGLKEPYPRGRTAMGLKDDSLVLVCIPDTVSDRLSTSDLCKLMLERGCKFAMNLDGGGSSQFKSPEGRYSSGRKCPAWLAIWLEKEKTLDIPKKERIKCVCTKKTHTVTSTGKTELTRYVAKGDLCTLGDITENCLIDIRYPTSIGYRNAFVKSLENFEPVK